MTNLFDSVDSRRSFLKKLTLSGLAGLLLPRRFLSASVKANSRVVIVKDDKATDGTPGGSIDSSVVQTMVDSGIKSLAQASDISDAWKVLLPGVTATSVVAIKVSAKGDGLPVHPEVAMAVGQSLAKMTFSGTPFPENNVIIFERSGGDLTNCGYTINKGSTGIRVMGTDAWSAEDYDVAGQSQKLSTFVTQDASFLISLSVLKNHGGPGVTLCMKNHYGTCNTPANLHGNSNLCDPYIAALNALEPIRTKQKLGIIDGLFGLRSGGPAGAPQFTANTLLMSSDVVAVDSCGMELLKSNGCTTTGLAGYIATAAGAPYSLGTNDPAQIDIVTLTNPSGVSDGQDSFPSSAVLHQNYPNPFNPSTAISYQLSANSFVTLKVFDVSGREVATLVNGRQNAGTHQVTFDAAGLTSGTYFCRLKAGSFVQTRKMALVR